MQERFYKSGNFNYKILNTNLSYSNTILFKLFNYFSHTDRIN